MTKKPYILVINIGSTSTKLGVFLDGIPILKKAVDHKEEELASLVGVKARLLFHKEVIEKALAEGLENRIKLHLVVSRGGATRPLKGGPYLITDTMCDDFHQYLFTAWLTLAPPAVVGDLGTKPGKTLKLCGVSFND